MKLFECISGQILENVCTFEEHLKFWNMLGQNLGIPVQIWLRRWQGSQQAAQPDETNHFISKDVAAVFCHIMCQLCPAVLLIRFWKVFGRIDGELGCLFCAQGGAPEPFWEHLSPFGWQLRFWTTLLWFRLFLFLYAGVSWGGSFVLKESGVFKNLLENRLWSLFQHSCPTIACEILFDLAANVCTPFAKIQDYFTSHFLARF